MLVVQARKDNDYDDDDDCIESTIRQESVRPRWPYDMRPSVRTEKYIRDASGWRKDVTDGNDNGTDGQTDRQSATQYAAPS